MFLLLLFFVSFVFVVVVHVADDTVVSIVVLIIVGPRNQTTNIGQNRVSNGLNISFFFLSFLSKLGQ